VSDGLRVVFDPAIDRGAWFGAPDPSVAATFGEASLGPSGLLGRLELELGLGARPLPALDRASALVPRLAAQDGWWRASYDADPLGACHRLLRDRDTLALWGWRGEPASDRLAELWRATAHAGPGLPDRLHAVEAAVLEERLPIAAIDVLCPPATLPPLWRTLLDTLGARGVRVTWTRPAATRARGDLASARTSRFEPRGDGSLGLLRAHGPLAAADEVAASLAALPSLHGVLVVGCDDVLDGALARLGLPRLGAPSRPSGSLALLRLVVEAAFEPMEPGDLHALLCLDPGPIPRGIAARLAGALGKLPGRRSALWRSATEEGLAQIDEGRRDALRLRLAALLLPAAARGGAVDTAEIRRRLHIVGGWARGRAESDPTLGAVALLAARAASLLDHLAHDTVTLTHLRRLCDDLEDGVATRSEAEAGLAAVDGPGAVLGPADVIVWWGFTRDGARTPPRLRLTRPEREALRRLGVTPPDPGLLMQDEAARWRRPLDQAARALILVCPRTDGAGEPAFPHPLWDELVAVMPDRQAAGALERSRLDVPAAPRRQPVPQRPLPAPVLAVSAGRSLPLRESESPSSLGKLLGCSLSWALHYHGRLRPGLSEGPAAPTPLLYGTLAHHLLAKVFQDGALGPERAAEKAAAVVDAELSAICETLDLPRYQVERTAVKHAIVESARELGRILEASGARVRGVEVELHHTLDGVALRGFADLVLGSPDVVLDLKWGRTTYVEKLKTGTALQLAAYAQLLAGGSTPPEAGYFVLKRQELLGEPGSVLPGATIPGTTRSETTWRAAMVSLARRRRELEAGQLAAPAADGTEVAARLATDGLTLEPECVYCSLDGLCGRSGCA
jgi:ATP-dependent helicase/nuclease subunit B